MPLTFAHQALVTHLLRMPSTCPPGLIHLPGVHALQALSHPPIAHAHQALFTHLVHMHTWPYSPTLAFDCVHDMAPGLATPPCSCLADLRVCSGKGGVLKWHAASRTRPHCP